MRSFCNYGDLELSRSSELKAKMRRINYEIQATADTRSTNGAVVSALACHQGDPGSNPSGGSLGRMLTMGTDERQESCTDDGYNPERALSTDACKNDGILTSQVEQKSKREKYTRSIRLAKKTFRDLGPHNSLTICIDFMKLVTGHV